MGEAFLSLWGCLDICPLLCQFHVTSITQLELSSLTSLKAWGDAEKFHSDIAFLLVSTEKGAAGDRVYGLSTIWVNPYKARVSTVGEAVKQLTALVSTGPPARRRNQQCHLWKGQPTTGPPASQLRFTGCLPSRAERVQDPCDNHPAQVPGQQHKPTWRQTHLPKGGHPTMHCGGARTKGIGIALW